MASYSPGLCEQAVRVVLDRGENHASQWAAVGSIPAEIGGTAETLRPWVRQAEPEPGERAGCFRGLRTGTAVERERIRASEREIRELRQTDDIQRKASACFAQAELDRRSEP